MIHKPIIQIYICYQFVVFPLTQINSQILIVTSDSPNFLWYFWMLVFHHVSLSLISSHKYVCLPFMNLTLFGSFSLSLSLSLSCLFNPLLLIIFNNPSQWIPLTNQSLCLCFPLSLLLTKGGQTGLCPPGLQWLQMCGSRQSKPCAFIISFSFSLCSFCKSVGGHEVMCNYDAQGYSKSAWTHWGTYCAHLIVMRSQKKDKSFIVWK